jgi:hypothetical protein
LKVALITSWPPEICGIASNAVNIVKHKEPDVEYRIIEGSAWAYPFTDEQVREESKDCDIVHLSYERNLHAGLTPNVFHELRRMGKKTVITYHNVWPDDHQDDDMLEAFDVVVSQDPKSPERSGFFYIPQGVMEVETVPDSKVEMKIGSAGFPTFFKGGHIMAQVAKELHLGMLLFAPASIHANSEGLTREVRARVPDAEIVHDFLPQEVIARRLSECVVTTWLYGSHAGQSGISGSVRLGLAAKRPMVVSKCGMYRDLYQATDDNGKSFEDELYFVETESPSFEKVLPVVEQALQGLKRPKRIVEYMSWVKGGKLYAQVYRKLMGAGVAA